MTPAKNRILALDIGRKRIGVAWTDALRIIATPIGTFSHETIIPELKKREPEVSDFVLGWPLSLDGSTGEATAMVEAFESRLKRQFRTIPIHRLDERFTSTSALQAIRQGGVKKMDRQKKELVDEVAASILLQHFLDIHQK